MKRNNRTEGSQYRYSPPPEDLRRLTVFGTQEVIKSQCTKCGEVKNLNEYYWVRGVKKSCCTVCHNKDTTQRAKKVGYNTVSYKLKKELESRQVIGSESKEKESINTLEAFFA